MAGIKGVCMKHVRAECARACSRGRLRQVGRFSVFLETIGLFNGAKSTKLAHLEMRIRLVMGFFF